MTQEPDQVHLTDVLDPARSAALLAALGRPESAGPGDALRPFFHQIHFWDSRPPERLGRDGHPAIGGLIPDMGLPRRMWAGGRLTFAAPVRLGTPATRTTTRISAVRKEGRTGPLAFVTLRHEIAQEGRLCVTEEQDLVYREDPAPGAPAPVPPVAPDDAEHTETARFDTTLLFRYSALTFNGHRIHYDVDYCRQVEGYPGLVVHGPLLGQLLMLMAERDLGGLRHFSFRNTAPLFQFETARLCRRGRDYWVAAPDGRQCVSATAG